ncbi:MAG: hypothetical protein HY303_05505 [Candidatus Wallbacteria bacterium]|nr:hypothetical protein [Candidatus Wallbacteria bacterium]
MLRQARVKDCDAIRALYDDIYGGAYPLELIRNPDVTRATIADANHLWMLLEADARAVGSVLFAFDPADFIGKVYGAVVRPELRGHDLMQLAIGACMKRLFAESKPLDILYATTRTVTPAPARLVTKLGFQNAGVFPNCHKVKTSETHGLDVYVRSRALENRLPHPKLVAEVAGLYEIARETFGLADEPTIEDVGPPNPGSASLRFKVLDDPALVARLYAERLADRQLRYCFFPFHEPHVLCQSADLAHEVFLHKNAADGYAAILGIKSDRADFSGLLDDVCEASGRLGLRYIEVLVSAFDPLKQREALHARFLPCAYFPAMKVTPGGQRMDYLVFSRSFERLDFTGIELEGTGRRYLQAFMKCWYAMLLAQAPDFEAQDKLF